MTEHFNLFSFLREIQKESSCKSVYCSTCGGLSYVLRRKLTVDLRDKIRTALSGMSVGSFACLDSDWRYFFRGLEPNIVRGIFERELESVDTSNVRELDHYLFYARRIMKGSEKYEKLLKKGVQVAVDTSNDSLIETLVIILGEDTLNYDQLLRLALKKSKSNKNIHRALYNSVREKVPEVRGFVG